MARWAAMLRICSSELQGYREIAWANSIDSKSDKNQGGQEAAESRSNLTPS